MLLENAQKLTTVFFLILLLKDLRPLKKPIFRVSAHASKFIWSDQDLAQGLHNGAAADEADFWGCSQAQTTATYNDVLSTVWGMWLNFQF